MIGVKVKTTRMHTFMKPAFSGTRPELSLLFLVHAGLLFFFLAYCMHHFYALRCAAQTVPAPAYAGNHPPEAERPCIR
jgi:hypothetical protein